MPTDYYTNISGYGSGMRHPLGTGEDARSQLIIPTNVTSHYLWPTRHNLSPVVRMPANWLYHLKTHSGEKSNKCSTCDLVSIHNVICHGVSESRPTDYTKLPPQVSCTIVFNGWANKCLSLLGYPRSIVSHCQHTWSLHVLWYLTFQQYQ